MTAELLEGRAVPALWAVTLDTPGLGIGGPEYAAGEHTGGLDLDRAALPSAGDAVLVDAPSASAAVKRALAGAVSVRLPWDGRAATYVWSDADVVGPAEAYDRGFWVERAGAEVGPEWPGHRPAVVSELYASPAAGTVWAARLEDLVKLGGSDGDWDDRWWHGTVTEVGGSTVHLGWTPNEGSGEVAVYSVPLVAGTVTPALYQGPPVDFSGPGVTVDWGDPELPGPTDGTEPYFYEAGDYAVTVTSLQGGVPVTTTFSIAVDGLPPPPVESQELDVPPEAVIGWDAVEGDVYYQVYRSPADAPTDEQSLGTTYRPDFVDGTIAAGEEYVYRIRSVHADGMHDDISVPYSPDTVAAGVAEDAPVARLANGPAAPPPPLVIARLNLATAADEAIAIRKLTARAEALEAADGKLFVGLYDMVVNRVPLFRGGTRFVYTGSYAFLPKDQVDARGDRTLNGDLKTAVDDLNTIATTMRVPTQSLPGGGGQFTTRDNAVVTAVPDGDWARLTVARPGKRATVVRVVSPVLNLQVFSPDGLTAEFDRIDEGFRRIVEDKLGAGLFSPGNRKPGGGYRQTPAEWADDKIFEQTVKNYQC